MSQTAITTAFEQWKARQTISTEPVVLDEFVFANVPGLNPAAPVSRTETLPPASQIVHRQAVSRTGVVSANAVAFSVVLGADVGNFTFNWIGLVNKASGILAMVVHAPAQQKLKTAAGQQGNVLTRSFLMEFTGAQAETGINTPAETWQIDFTARMAGMDERQRLENIDIYGMAAFFGDGFMVGRTGTQYFVTQGAGYVAGLRAQLEVNQNIALTAKPVNVWLDVCWTGTLTSAWTVQSKITVAANLADYVQNGVQHYVFALASIDAGGTITDLRPKGSLIAQNADSALRLHEQSRNHPDATLTEKGFVVLSSATNSTSQAMAATPAAVKVAFDNAEASLKKNQNGADITDKRQFARTIAAAYASSGAVDIGGDSNSWTTGEFIAWLEAQGAFSHPYWMCRGSWNYATNKIITDTGCGNIQLAGAVVEVMGNRYAMTIRVTTPTTATGANAVTKAEFIYINNQDSFAPNFNYQPGWRRSFNTANPPAPSDVGAVAKGGDTMTGGLRIIADGEPLAVRGVTPGESSYIISRDYAGASQWYIGKGSSYSDNVSFLNYKGGNNGLMLKATGGIEMTTRNSEPVSVNAEIVSTYPNALRMAYGEYGAFWRQDNVNTYLLLTNKGDPYGNYNSLRPLTINNATGNIYINRLSLNDYSNFDARYSFKNTASLSANGWFKDASTGLITQWGRVISGAIGYLGVAFPIAFPNACVGISCTADRTGMSAGDGNWSSVRNVSRTGFEAGSDLNGSYWIAKGF